MKKTNIPSAATIATGICAENKLLPNEILTVRAVVGMPCDQTETITGEAEAKGMTTLIAIEIWRWIGGIILIGNLTEGDPQIGVTVLEGTAIPPPPLRLLGPFPVSSLLIPTSLHRCSYLFFVTLYAYYFILQTSAQI